MSDPSSDDPSSDDDGTPVFDSEPARKMWQANWALMHLLVASGILLWAALENAPAQYVWFGHGREGLLTYAVVVAAVSLVVSSLLVIALTTIGDSGLRTSLFTVPRLGAVNVSTVISVAFAVWWCAAAGVLTFNCPGWGHIAPYGTLSNGYFALWLGSACSLSMLNKAFGHPMGPDALVGNLACSVVVLIAAICLNDPDEPTVTWAMSVGAASSANHLVILLIGINKLRKGLLKMMAVLLLLLWTPAAAVLTFKGPFTSAADSSNGFFGAWLGLLSALAFARDHL
eukprot:scaffold17888_cov149-Isochrysis_galbana.AAC.4